jgi:hypothetical protein
MLKPDMFGEGEVITPTEHKPRLSDKISTNMEAEKDKEGMLQTHIHRCLKFQAEANLDVSLSPKH